MVLAVEVDGNEFVIDLAGGQFGFHEAAMGFDHYMSKRCRPATFPNFKPLGSARELYNSHALAGDASGHAFMTTTRRMTDAIEESLRKKGHMKVLSSADVKGIIKDRETMQSWKDAFIAAFTASVDSAVQSVDPLYAQLLAEEQAKERNRVGQTGRVYLLAPPGSYARPSI